MVSLILLILIGIMFIVRIRNTYKMLKNPIVQKGIIYHLICFAILSVVHISEPTGISWDEEQKIEKAVTFKYFQSHLKGSDLRFGKVDETTYPFYKMKIDYFFDYDERQELNRKIDKAIDEKYDSIRMPDFVYFISEKLSYVIIILWVVLSFALEPMTKALVFAFSIITLGLLFSYGGRDGSDISNDNSTPLKEDPNNTFVDPHYVNAYEKQDGTNVEGYWRDGDGDTSTKLSSKEGGGYWRSHPDGHTNNNLKS